MLQRLRDWMKPKEGFQSYPGRLLLLFLRGLFGALFILIATGLLFYFADRNDLSTGVLSFLLVVGLGGVVVLMDVLVKNKQITTISAIYFGLLMGFLLGTLFWLALQPLI